MALRIDGTTGIFNTTTNINYGSSSESNLFKFIKPHFKAIHYNDTASYKYSLRDAQIPQDKLPLTIPIYDNVSGFDLTNYQYVAKYAGTYLISGSLHLTTVSYLNALAVYLAINNVFQNERGQINGYGNFVGGLQKGFMHTIEAVVNLNVGDTVSLYAYADSNYGTGTVDVNSINAVTLSGYLINFSSNYFINSPYTMPQINSINFSSSQNWVTPSSYTTLTVEIWGGGGSGGISYNGDTASYGGQGGSYKKYTIPSTVIPPNTTVPIIVGAGGTPVKTNAGNAGNPGGYSVFNGAVWAIGGYGGAGQSELQKNPSTYSVVNSSTGYTLVTQENGGNGGYVTAGGSVTYAGGGGGGGQNTGGVYQSGGTSTYGGAGGRGVGGSDITLQPLVDGRTPAGGGGGRDWYYPTGRGGRGRVKVTWV